MLLRLTLVLLILIVISIGQIPFVIVSFEVDVLLPHSVILDPIEIILALIFFFVEIVRPYGGRYVAISLFALIIIDLFVSFFAAFHFFNPFSDEKYVSVIPATIETIRFQNRELIYIIIAAVLCVAYLIQERRQVSA